MKTPSLTCLLGLTGTVMVGVSDNCFTQKLSLLLLTWFWFEKFGCSLQCCMFLLPIETTSKSFPRRIRHGSDKVPEHLLPVPTLLVWHQ